MDAEARLKGNVFLLNPMGNCNFHKFKLKFKLHWIFLFAFFLLFSSIRYFFFILSRYKITLYLPVSIFPSLYYYYYYYVVRSSLHLSSYNKKKESKRNKDTETSRRKSLNVNDDITLIYTFISSTSN